jgi:5'-nucleotidase
VRILVTNDDGVRAAGLHVLADQLVRDGHDVLVAAPLQERSGSGTSLGTIVDGASIRCVETTLPTPSAIPAFGIDAPPAMVVRAACEGALGAPPELVVSGINPGHNSGVLLIHSGTVGAAMTAVSLGVSAIAVSAGSRPHSRFDTAAALCSRTISALRDHAAAGPVAISLNVPDVDLEDVRGLVLAPVGATSLTDVSMTRNGEVLTLHRINHAEITDTEGDSAEIRRGYATLTPLLFGMDSQKSESWRHFVGKI